MASTDGKDCEALSRTITGAEQVCKDRVALITGGSGTIGRSCALAFASTVPRIAIGYHNNLASATSVCEELSEVGAEALAVQADVGNMQEVSAMFGSIEERWSTIDTLVVCAGGPVDGLMIRMSVEQFESVIRRDLVGAFNVIRRAIPRMIRARRGRIIVVSSVVGSSGNAGQANYAAAKSGLVGLVRSTAREVAKRNVTVNIVAAGPVEGQMMDSVPASIVEGMLVLHPMGRMGQPEEIASAVRFLASEEASYITGAVLPVDGGMVMAC